MATKIPDVGWESGKKWPEIGLQKFPWIDTQGVGMDTQNQGL